jgi:diguanylate cyclase (GGDEF)-like protein/PAS domain S-box-containing protein
MHNLLKRQLRRYFEESLQIPTEWQKFIEAVNDAYIQSDIDRGMLERSLDLSSQELLHANSEMMGLISLLNSTIESTADGILVVNKQGKIVSFNQRFVEMWHIPQQIIESCDDNQVLSFVLDQLKDPEGFIKRVRELYGNPEAESFDELNFKDGRVFERYSQPQRIGETVVGRVWSFRDVTERKRMEEELKALSLNDGLTGLYNRRGFITLAEQQLKFAYRMKRGIVLLFADLDGLKLINDNFGHREGDRALIDTAYLLKNTFRGSDITARIGGDEFVVLALDTNEAYCEVLISRLKKNISIHNTKEDRPYKLMLSVGTAHYDPENPCTIEQLLEYADKLMYEEKQRKIKT